MRTGKILIAFLLILTQGALATDFEGLYRKYSADGFTDTELVGLYNVLVKSPKNKNHTNAFIYAVRTPYAPANAHAGQKFFEALSWYNDMTTGDRNGKFTTAEVSKTINTQANKYIQIIQSRHKTEDRIGSWKMIQKLTMLSNEIKKRAKSGYGSFYPYSPRKLGAVNYNTPWNKINTISSRADFDRRVIDASFAKPVLVKFGLTYCVHCLLLENLGSVPAVAAKYKNKISVYKLWWNPKDNNNYRVFNTIANEQGVTSSPYFILYKNGRQVNAGYGFPDENGNGLEKFLAPVL